MTEEIKYANNIAAEHTIKTKDIYENTNKIIDVIDTMSIMRRANLSPNPPTKYQDAEGLLGVIDDLGNQASLSTKSLLDPVVDSVILGSDGDDIIQGTIKNDYLYGGAGNDRLVGDKGDDILIGGIGNDRLESNDGNDILIGGTGDDILNGGKGADTYIFSGNYGNDTIIDYEHVANGNINPVDTVKFTDVNFDDVQIILNRDDMILRTSEANSVTLANFLLMSNYHIENFEFADKTVSLQTKNSRY